MRFLSMSALAISLAVVLALPAEARQVRKQADFIKTLAGKTLTSGDSWLMLTADGKITGVTGKGQKIVGLWVWNKRFMCRNVYIGQKQLPQDCQTVSIDDNTVTFTRERGKGPASIFNF